MTPTPGPAALQRQVLRIGSGALVALAIHLALPDAALAFFDPGTAPTAISPPLDSVHEVAAGDLDGDGDVDLVSVRSVGGGVHWHKNLVGNGSVWTTHAIASLGSGGPLALGDVDGDGDLDIVAGVPGATGSQARVVWLENLGQAASFASRTVDNATLTSASGLALADIDRDGDLDIAACSQGGPVGWYENDGTPASGTWLFWLMPGAVSGTPRAVAVGDMDRDGDPDLVVAEYDADRIVWYQNDPNDELLWVRRVARTGLDGVVSIALGDPDRDGDLDVAYTTQIARHVGWVRNDGGSPPAFSLPMAFLAPTETWKVLFADLDGDSWPDLVSCDSPFSGGTSAVRWFAGPGLGSPQAAVVHTGTAISGVRGLAVADADGDGDLDVLSASFHADLVHWHRNRKVHRNAAFAARFDVSDTLDVTQAVVAADVNGDGRTDLVATGYGSGRLVWFENDGSPFAGVWPQRTIDATLANPRSVAVADLDRDGRPDLITGEDHPTGRLYRYRNLGGSPPAFARTDLGLAQTHRVTAADLDRDGWLDIVTAGGSSLRWFENPGTGPAWVARTIATSVTPRGLAVGDLDRDGDPEVAIGEFGGGLRVYLHNGAAPPQFTAQHLVSAPYTDGTFSVAMHDLDRDGDLDLLYSAADGQALGWYENDGGSPLGYPHRLLLNDGRHHRAVAADLDADGDLDLVASSVHPTGPVVDQVTRLRWLENDGGSPPAFTPRAISVTPLAGGNGQIYDIAIADLDRDGRLDLATAAFDTDRLSIWQDFGGSLGFEVTPYGPTPIAEGATHAVLKCVARHLGRPGDPSVRLSGASWRLGLSPEVALSSAQYEALFTATGFAVDDGSGEYEPGSDPGLAAFGIAGGGDLSMIFTDQAAARVVSFGSPKTFFLVVGLEPDAAAQSPNDFHSRVLSTGAEVADFVGTIGAWLYPAPVTGASGYNVVVSVVGAPAPGPGGPSVLHPVAPNPLLRDGVLRFRLGGRGAARLEIFAVTGQRVRSFELEADAPGERSVTWDRTDGVGRPLPAGTYLVRLTAPDRTETRRLVLLR